MFRPNRLSGLLKTVRDLKCVAVRCNHVQSEGQKTTITVLNKEMEDMVMIDAYSPMGFTLNNGLRVIGPIAVFPKSVLCWNVASCEKITPESLSLFHLMEPKIDMLILGIGDSKNKLNPNIVPFLRQKKIAFEILPTDKACSIFNFLNSEGRFVAGAMLPPSDVTLVDQDIVDSKNRQKEIYESSDLFKDT